MKTNEQTLQQIERALRKTAEKFPVKVDIQPMTDIHIRVTQESGELRTFDDDDHELTRCVVEEWIDDKSDDFYTAVASTLRKVIKRMEKQLSDLPILKPYSFVLEDDDRETIEELYVAGNDTVIIDPLMMQDLDEDLDNFLRNLLEEDNDKKSTEK